MVAPANAYPRFLPTLTEVVQVPVQPPEPAEDLAAIEAARRAAFADRLRTQLHAALDRRMQDAVTEAMLEQVDVIGDRLRLQMEDMVRESLDSITDRLRAEFDAMLRQAVETVLSDDPPPDDAQTQQQAADPPV